MAAYLVFALDITNPEGFREYAERVGPTHEHFGGKLLVPGQICETLEGEWRPNRLAMLEFESAELLTFASTIPAGLAVSPPARMNLPALQYLSKNSLWQETRARVPPVTSWD